MRLRQIEVFHAVYSSGSVTRAAEILNVSQPSVSKVLAHAEQQLGYPLFDRVRGKLVPTAEADRLFSYVTTVYENVDRLRHVAENLRSAESGRIRIAATPAFGFDLLPSSMASFRERNKDVVFAAETLHYSEMCGALLDASLDIGLAFDPASVPGITEQVIAHGNFVVLAPRKLQFGNKRVLAIKDLAEHGFIKLDSRGPLGQLLSTHIDSSGVELNTVAYSETYHVAKALVAYGAGVTITDEVTAYAKGHDEVRIWPLKPSLQFRVSVLSIDSVPIPRVAQRFIEHLQQTTTAYLETQRTP